MLQQLILNSLHVLTNEIFFEETELRCRYLMTVRLNGKVKIDEECFVE